MIDDLRERFLPRFVATARERLERASKLVGDGANAAGTIAADLHTIAGEASIMGLHEIAALARDAERTVRAVGGLDDANILTAVYKVWRGLDALEPRRHSG